MPISTEYNKDTHFASSITQANYNRLPPEELVTSPQHETFANVLPVGLHDMTGVRLDEWMIGTVTDSGFIQPVLLHDQLSDWCSCDVLKGIRCSPGESHFRAPDHPSHRLRW